MRPFQKRKPKQKKYVLPYVELRTSEGESAFSGRIDQLVIPEDLVVRLSILYFNDPAPCYIHKGAVLSRVYAEMEEAMEEGMWTRIGELEPMLQEALAGYSAREIRMTREGKG